MILNTAITADTANSEIKEPLSVDSVENKICDKILDVCFDVHKKYGPGLLESAYEKIVAHDLVHKKKLQVQTQKILPIYHDGVVIESGYRLDLLIEDKVIIELKAVEKVAPIFQAQLMTYLKLSQIRLGLIINFNEKLLKNGIRRIVI